MEFNKIAEAHHTQDLPVQTIEPISSPKQLQGREVKLSTITKIAIGSAAISALAFTYYTAYNYFSPNDPQQPGNDPQQPANDPQQPANDPQQPGNDPQQPSKTHLEAAFEKEYQTNNFDIIDQFKMRKIFNISSRSLTSEESNQLLIDLKKANHKVSLEAMKQFNTNPEMVKFIQRVSSSTNYEAKLFARTRGPILAELSAEWDDFTHIMKGSLDRGIVKIISYLVA